MTKPTTVWGVATKIGGIAQERSAAGRVTGHSYDDLALELPDDGVVVDLDHNREPVGRLIYGEIADDGALQCVVVLDGDEIRTIQQDVFFSPELLMLGTGVNERSYIAREAQLLGLALTLSPATLGARAVNWMPGDLRSNTDRYNWPVSWRHSYPLLATPSTTSAPTGAREPEAPRGSSTGDPATTTHGSSEKASGCRPAGAPASCRAGCGSQRTAAESSASAECRSRHRAWSRAGLCARHCRQSHHRCPLCT